MLFCYLFHSFVISLPRLRYKTVNIWMAPKCLEKHHTWDERAVRNVIAVNHFVFLNTVETEALAVLHLVNYDQSAWDFTAYEHTHGTWYTIVLLKNISNFYYYKFFGWSFFTMSFNLDVNRLFLCCCAFKTLHVSFCALLCFHRGCMFAVWVQKKFAPFHLHFSHGKYMRIWRAVDATPPRAA